MYLGITSKFPHPFQVSGLLALGNLDAPANTIDTKYLFVFILFYQNKYLNLQPYKMIREHDISTVECTDMA